MKTSEKPARKRTRKKLAPAQASNSGASDTFMAPRRAMYQPTAAAWKGDAGKVRLDLLPFAALEDVARVLEYGAAKYQPQGWRAVADGHDRYVAAALRHLHAYAGGEVSDRESGLSHLAHAACSILFALEVGR